MTYSQCKYKSVCPSYDQNSIKCTFFYNWCKIPKQTTNRLADEIFGKIVELHSQQNINSSVGNSIKSDNTPKQRIETGSADTTQEKMSSNLIEGCLELSGSDNSPVSNLEETLFVGSRI
jgi:hypothetical protein